MNLTNVEQIVNAVLYQDHILYPYRSSARNGRRQSFTPGRIYPDSYCVAQNGAEACMMQTECLLHCHTDNPTLNVRVRFLHPAWREIQVPASDRQPLSVGEPEFRVVPEIVARGKLYQTWQETLEREVTVWPISLQENEHLAVTHSFHLSAWGEVESLGDGEDYSNAILVRRQEALEGRVEIAARPLSSRCFSISVRVRNETPVPVKSFADCDEVSMRTFTAAHTILHAQGAEFVSMTNPPAEFVHCVNTCENLGTWPVLVGNADAGERHTMLSSPVLLPDYPQVPLDSPVEAIDARELDALIEMRQVRIAAAESRETDNIASNCNRRKPLRDLRGVEPRSAFGVRRDWTAPDEFFVNPKPVASAVRNGVEIKAGDHVRIAPRNHADVLDLILAGRIATVESLEQDAAERVQLSVALLPALPSQPEHHFVYRLDEIEPLTSPLA